MNAIVRNISLVLQDEYRYLLSLVLMDSSYCIHQCLYFRDLGCILS
ncbi:hypothetical protein [Vibrio gallaecicus]|nr:hypothetical protein [Vibrio gallaecicus]MDN3616789.1 hypothetical protein [Vibrio gallaecicus]